jgi:hypothetical protein
MPHAEINVPDLILVGRFSSDPHWPVLGDRWGEWSLFKTRLVLIAVFLVVIGIAMGLHRLFNQ